VVSESRRRCRRQAARVLSRARLFRCAYAVALRERQMGTPTHKSVYVVGVR